MEKVYILLADGFETIEALTPADVLHRCGVDVKTVSVSENKVVASSHRVTVVADLILSQSDISDGDAIIVPGGYPGYVNLGESAAVGEILKKYYAANKIVAAICGGPTVLAKNKIAEGKTLTCHTSVRNQMTAYNCTAKDVERDGNLLTGVGAGHSLDFAFLIAEQLVDKETIAKVHKGMELK